MAEINVVPYIDVMLVLLVIFMITAPLITAGVNVDLPDVDAETLPADEEPPLVVSIDQSGNYYLSLGQSPDTALELRTVIELILEQRKINPKTKVVINGDKNALYGKVVKVMASLQKHVGIDNVQLMTDSDDD